MYSSGENTFPAGRRKNAAHSEAAILRDCENYDEHRRDDDESKSAPSTFGASIRNGYKSKTFNFSEIADIDDDHHSSTYR